MAITAHQPPEVLIKLSTIKTSRVYLLKHLPRAMYKLISTVPMPWELDKQVTVRYHGSGGISIIANKNKMTKREFIKRWKSISALYKRNHPRRYEDESRVNVYESRVNEEYKKVLLRLYKKNREWSDNGANYIKGTVSRELNRELNEKRDPANAERRPKKILKNLNSTVNKYLHGLDNRRYPMHDINLHAPAKKSQRDSPVVNRQGYSPMSHSVNSRAAKIDSGFYTTELEWTEAGTILLLQGRQLLNALLKKQKVYSFEVNSKFDHSRLEHVNINMKTGKSIMDVESIMYAKGNENTLGTKEKKRSRKGMTFHLIREMLKLLQLIVDAFILHRLGGRTASQHYSTLLGIFKSVGTLTGIYRYKYKSINQINRSKRTGKLWVEPWRIWCKFFQGHIPFLENNISNMLHRLSDGREKREKPVTKQRVESKFDLELKREIVKRVGNGKRCLMLFNEMWRNWRSDNINWDVKSATNCGDRGDSTGCNNMNGATNCNNMEGVSNSIMNGVTNCNNMEGVSNSIMNGVTNGSIVTSSSLDDGTHLNSIMEHLNECCQIKADWYVQEAFRNVPGEGKKELKKRMGKILRLYIKNERKRQEVYLVNPHVPVDYAVSMVRAMKWRLGGVAMKGKANKKMINEKIHGIATDTKNNNITSDIATDTKNNNITSDIATDMKNNNITSDIATDTKNNNITSDIATDMKNNNITSGMEDKIKFPDASTVKYLRKARRFLIIHSRGKEKEYWREISVEAEFERIRTILLTRRVFLPGTLGIKVNPECALMANSELITESNENEMCMDREVNGVNMKANEGEENHPARKNNSYTIWCSFSPEEKLVDTFLSFYFWGESKRLKLWPDYLYEGLPNELEIISAISSRIEAVSPVGNCQSETVSPIAGSHQDHSSSRSAIHQYKYRNLHKNIDFIVLTKLLKLIMDPILVDYVIARMNCKLIYKDMEMIVNFGLLRGIGFSSFIEHYWSYSIDLVHFDGILFKYSDTVLVAGKMPRRHLNESSGHLNESSSSWISGKMPRNIGEIQCIKKDGNFVIGPFTMINGVTSNTSVATPNAFASVAITSAFVNEDRLLIANSFKFSNYSIQARKDSLQEKCRDIVRYCSDGSFITIVNKWNGVLWEYIDRYREYSNEESIRLCESLIKGCIKEGTSSKMNTRFPEGFYYLPRETGGLGMVAWELIDFRDGRHGEINDRRQSIEKTKRVKRAGPLDGKDDAVTCDYNYPSTLVMNLKYSNKPVFNFKGPVVKIPRDKIIERYKNEGLTLGTVLNWDAKNRTMKKDHVKRDVTKRDAQGNNEVTSYAKGNNKVASCNSQMNPIRNLWKAPEFKNQTRAQKAGESKISNKKLIFWWSPSLNSMNVHIGYRERIEETGIVVYGKMNIIRKFYGRIFEDKLWYKIYVELVESVRKEIEYSLKSAGGHKVHVSLKRESEVYEHNDGDHYELSAAIREREVRDEYNYNRRNKRGESGNDTGCQTTIEYKVAGNIKSMERVESLLWRRMLKLGAPGGNRTDANPQGNANAFNIKVHFDVIWKTNEEEFIKMVKGKDREDYFYVIVDIFGGEFLCMGYSDEKTKIEIENGVKRFLDGSKWLNLMRIRILGELGYMRD